MEPKRRVTLEVLRGLAAGAHSRQQGTVLVWTDDGLRFMAPGAVLAPGSTARQYLYDLTSLQEEAGSYGLSVSAFLREHGAELARELNNILDEEEDTR